VTLRALFFAITMCLLIDELLSAGEVHLDLIITWHFTLHPWVRADLVHGGALLWVESHHLLEKVLEIG